MAVSYYTMMRAAWEKIWAIVAQNSEKNYSSLRSNGEDVMERLLSGG
jgi:hypothetical protein